MAGAGYKLFNTGDVLTAAQVNTYLMEQTVMVFADAAARTTALSGVVSEGMISYLKDTNAVEVYNGSAWVASDDPNAIQNSIVDAKGDLISASAADTPARLAVGNNGESLVADSSTTTGLRWQGNFAAGKNKVLNGDFRIWQRGTSFTIANAYNADRFNSNFDGSGVTRTVSQQTFTPGTAPVVGYEGLYFLRVNTSVAGTGQTFSNLQHWIEDVRTLAGETVTLSFWMKADSSRTVTSPLIVQNFGTGGSAAVNTSLTGDISATTTWTRFSYTFTMPSVSGKTIGAGSYIVIRFRLPSNTTSTIDIWGIQLESGNTATAFQTASGNIELELAACQRYYQRYTAGHIANGFGASTTVAQFILNHKVPLRNATLSLGQNTMLASDTVTAHSGGTWAIVGSTTDSYGIGFTRVSYTHGSADLTQFRPYFLGNSDGNSWMEVSAEL